MAELRMPKMGDGMEEGTINAWLKKEGEQVIAGEPIAEVETDKANVEISSYETGVLTKILVNIGETVPVGAVIAQIGDGAGSSVPAAAAGSHSEAAALSAPMHREPAEVNASNGSAASHVSEAPMAERVKASPLARRIMAEKNVDAAMVHGSGPGGRIVERDVKVFLETHHSSRPLTPAFPSVEPVIAGVLLPEVERSPRESALPSVSAQDMKPSNMRKAIANRTQKSKQTIPHFYVTMRIEMDRALAMLKELNQDAADGKVTVNDIIVKACAIALSKVPQANSTWTEENTVRTYAEAHIGVAVGIDEGLIVPVIRDCHVRTLRQISSEAKQLIAKARAGQLKPEEYTGGTFSVSNLGMMGVDEFIAIINPPEAAILAIGGVVREPVVLNESDEIAIRSYMKVTISADHRLLDGVIAAKFLQEVKKSLEAPFSLLS